MPETFFESKAKEGWTFAKTWRRKHAHRALARAAGARRMSRSQSLLAEDQQEQPQALPNADHAKAA